MLGICRNTDSKGEAGATMICSTGKVHFKSLSVYCIISDRDKKNTGFQELSKVTITSKTGINMFIRICYLSPSLAFTKGVMSCEGAPE